MLRSHNPSRHLSKLPGRRSAACKIIFGSEPDSAYASRCQRAPARRPAPPSPTTSRSSSPSRRQLIGHDRTAPQPRRGPIPVGPSAGRGCLRPTGWPAISPSDRLRRRREPALGRPGGCRGLDQRADQAGNQQVSAAADRRQLPPHLHRRIAVGQPGIEVDHPLIQRRRSPAGSNTGAISDDCRTAGRTGRGNRCQTLRAVAGMPVSWRPRAANLPTARSAPAAGRIGRSRRCPLVSPPDMDMAAAGQLLDSGEAEPLRHRLISGAGHDLRGDSERGCRDRHRASR